MSASTSGSVPHEGTSYHRYPCIEKEAQQKTRLNMTRTLLDYVTRAISNEHEIGKLSSLPKDDFTKALRSRHTNKQLSQRLIDLKEVIPRLNHIQSEKTEGSTTPRYVVAYSPHENKDSVVAAYERHAGKTYNAEQMPVELVYMVFDLIQKPYMLYMVAPAMFVSGVSRPADLADNEYDYRAVVFNAQQSLALLALLNVERLTLASSTVRRAPLQAKACQQLFLNEVNEIFDNIHRRLCEFETLRREAAGKSAEDPLKIEALEKIGPIRKALSAETFASLAKITGMLPYFCFIKTMTPKTLRPPYNARFMAVSQAAFDRYKSERTTGKRRASDGGHLATLQDTGDSAPKTPPAGNHHVRAKSTSRKKSTHRSMTEASDEHKKRKKKKKTKKKHNEEEELAMATVESSLTEENFDDSNDNNAEEDVVAMDLASSDEHPEPAAPNRPSTNKQLSAHAFERLHDGDLVGSCSVASLAVKPVAEPVIFVGNDEDDNTSSMDPFSDEASVASTQPPDDVIVVASVPAPSKAMLTRELPSSSSSSELSKRLHTLLLDNHTRHQLGIANGLTSLTDPLLQVARADACSHRVTSSVQSSSSSSFGSRANDKEQEAGDEKDLSWSSAVERRLDDILRLEHEAAIAYSATGADDLASLSLMDWLLAIYAHDPKRTVQALTKFRETIAVEPPNCKCPRVRAEAKNYNILFQMLTRRFPAGSAPPPVTSSSNAANQQRRTRFQEFMVVGEALLASVSRFDAAIQAGCAIKAGQLREEVARLAHNQEKLTKEREETAKKMQHLRAQHQDDMKRLRAQLQEQAAETKRISEEYSAQQQQLEEARAQWKTAEAQLKQNEKEAQAKLKATTAANTQLQEEILSSTQELAALQAEIQVERSSVKRLTQETAELRVEFKNTQESLHEAQELNAVLQKIANQTEASIKILQKKLQLSELEVSKLKQQRNDQQTAPSTARQSSEDRPTPTHNVGDHRENTRSDTEKQRKRKEPESTHTSKSTNQRKKSPTASSAARSTSSNKRISHENASPRSSKQPTSEGLSSVVALLSRIDAASPSSSSASTSKSTQRRRQDTPSVQKRQRQASSSTSSDSSVSTTARSATPVTASSSSSSSSRLSSTPVHTSANKTASVQYAPKDTASTKVPTTSTNTKRADEVDAGLAYLQSLSSDFYELETVVSINQSPQQPNNKKIIDSKTAESQTSNSSAKTNDELLAEMMNIESDVVMSTYDSHIEKPSSSSTSSATTVSNGEVCGVDDEEDLW